MFASTLLLLNIAASADRSAPARWGATLALPGPADNGSGRLVRTSLTCLACQALPDTRRSAVTSRCSFCTKSSDEVGTLVAGAGVFICNECVELCAVVIAEKRTSETAPRVPLWEQIDDQALLAHLPRIEAVRDQVDDDLR